MSEEEAKGKETKAEECKPKEEETKAEENKSKEEETKGKEETKKEDEAKVEESKPKEEVKKEKEEVSKFVRKEGMTNLEFENERDVLKGINELKDLSTSLKLKFLGLSEVNNKMVKEKEVNYHKKYLELKNKYEKEYNELYKATNDIVFSTSEPTTLTEEDYKMYNISKNPTDNKPIPDFWLTTIKNTEYFSINEKDEKVLKYLKNIRIMPFEESLVHFQVEFEFDENEFFEGKILSKVYKYHEEEDKIVEVICNGPKWKGDFDPTKKVTVKKVKKKKRVETNTIIKNVKSFFNIFDIDKNKNMEKAYEEASYFKTDLLPNALEYYMDILEKLNFEEEEEEEDK